MDVGGVEHWSECIRRPPKRRIDIRGFGIVEPQEPCFSAAYGAEGSTLGAWFQSLMLNASGMMSRRQTGTEIPACCR